MSKFKVTIVLADTAPARERMITWHASGRRPEISCIVSSSGRTVVDFYSPSHGGDVCVLPGRNDTIIIEPEAE